jgi:hypothetical protein
MTIPLTKLIAENKERPIAEASRKTNSRFLLKIDTCWVVGFWNGFSWEGEDDGLLLYPTHFRPLPDDRLAFVAEHYRAGVDAFISMFEPLAEKSFYRALFVMRKHINLSLAQILIEGLLIMRTFLLLNAACAALKFGVLVINSLSLHGTNAQHPPHQQGSLIPQNTLS